MTVEHVCGIAVRNPTIVEVSRHYGLTIATCEPADPQSKGGSEATVKIAKADLVPTDHNLRDEYADWQALELACEQFMAEVNTRPHRATREAPVNEALERCASYGRFADGDLASVLVHQQHATIIPLPLRASEESSLQASTRSWEGFGL